MTAATIVIAVTDSAIDRTDQLVGLLKQLAELRDQGILTDQEFTDQKERLLSGDTDR
jgi:hypothetical protein